MKYMEIPELSSLSRSLHHTSAECTVHTRIEAYSCKSINKDKKLFASLEHSYLEDMATSRSYPCNGSPDDITPFGPLGHPSARKTLYLLIATLNVAFPDHSFSSLRPDSFVREPSGAHILNALSTTLISQRARPTTLGESPTRSYASYPPPPDPEASNQPFFPSSVPTSSSPPNPFNSIGNGDDIMSGTHPTLYKVLDNVIKLSECEVYSYTPDVNMDPHAGDSDDDEPESDEEFEDDEGEYEFEDEITCHSEPEDDSTFLFEEDSDEAVAMSPPKSRWIDDPARKRTSSSDFSSLESPKRTKPRRISFIGRRRRPRAPLLWSSHWFFYNKKLKRVLFISVWARKKAWPISSSGLDEDLSRSLTTSNETFKGWVGDVGAGARALGLAKSL
ncbi:hypothetical protein M422DRAFT_156626 [Sphaerobolus stellatus SS14]|nr:hypothetical protein M422DRAFT_156626 [Sphaerobolus stellatus SS14]